MIEVELFWPNKVLSPNSRTHWRRKSLIASQAKRNAYLFTMEVLGRDKPEFNDNIPITVEFYPPDKRRRDIDNAFSSLKSAIDGVAQAIEVDDCRFVWKLERHEPVKNGKIILKIEERKENGPVSENR